MEIIDRETAQYIVDTVKSVCGKDINYIDARGIIIASTDHSRVDSFHEIGYQVVTQGDTKEVSGDESFWGVQKGVNLPVFYHGKVIAAVGISGDVEEARKYAALAQKITTILLRERELEARGSQKRSKISYMLRMLLRQDITDYTELKAFFKENGIRESGKYRMAFVNVRSDVFAEGMTNPVLRVFEKISPWYIYEYPGEYVLLLKESDTGKAIRLLQELTRVHEAEITAGMGMLKELSHISQSWQEARMAQRSVQGRKGFCLYEELGFEMLLGNVSEKVKTQYIAKILQGLASEDIQILKVYYSQDMSLQKTCELLNMHKNTLQYRLNRIREICGYDPRRFRDGVSLYTAVRMQAEKDEKQKNDF